MQRAALIFAALVTAVGAAGNEGEGNEEPSVDPRLDGNWVDSCITAEGYLRHIVIEGDEIEFRYDYMIPDTVERGYIQTSMSTDPYEMDIVITQACEAGSCEPVLRPRAAIYQLEAGQPGAGDGEAEWKSEGEFLGNLTIAWNHDGTRPADFKSADESYTRWGGFEWNQPKCEGEDNPLEYDANFLQENFDLLDTSGDGYLQLTEWPTAEIAFYRFDRDGSGRVSFPEVTHCLGYEFEENCLDEGEIPVEGEMNGTVQAMLQGVWNADCTSHLEVMTFDGNAMELSFGNPAPELSETAAYSINTAVEPYQMDIVSKDWCAAQVCGPACAARRAIFSIGDNLEGEGVGGENHLRIAWNYDGTRPASFAEADEYHDLFDGPAVFCYEGEVFVDINAFRWVISSRFDSLDLNDDDRLTLDEWDDALTLHCVYDADEDGAVSRAEAESCDGGEGFCEPESDEDPELLGLWQEAFCGDSPMDQATFGAGTFAFEYGNILVPDGVRDTGTYVLDTSVSPKRMTLRVEQRCVGEDCVDPGLTFNAAYEIVVFPDFKGQGSRDLDFAWNNDGSIPTVLYEADEYYSLTDFGKGAKCEGDFEVNVNRIAERRLANFDNLDGNGDHQLTLEEAYLDEIVFWIIDTNRDGYLTEAEMDRIAEGEEGEADGGPAPFDGTWYTADCSRDFEESGLVWSFDDGTFRESTPDSSCSDYVGYFTYDDTVSPKQVDIVIDQSCTFEFEGEGFGGGGEKSIICGGTQVCEPFSRNITGIYEQTGAVMTIAWNDNGVRPSSIESADRTRVHSQDIDIIYDLCVPEYLKGDWYVKTCGIGTQRLSFDAPDFEQEYLPLAGAEPLINGGDFFSPWGSYDEPLLVFGFYRCEEFERPLGNGCEGSDGPFWSVIPELDGDELVFHVLLDLEYGPFEIEDTDFTLRLQREPLDCVGEEPESCEPAQPDSAIFDTWVLGDCDDPARRWTLSGNMGDGDVLIEPTEIDRGFDTSGGALTFFTGANPKRFDYAYTVSICQPFGGGCSDETRYRRYIYELCGDTLKLGWMNGTTFPDSFETADAVAYLKREDIACGIDGEAEPPGGEAQPTGDLAMMAAALFANLGTVDTNSDNQISLAESGLSGEDFDALDLDDDGQLTTVELQYGAGALSPYHDADIDRNGGFTLSELLRVVQFYNALGYTCDPESNDGYAVWLGDGLRDTTCPAHASDFIDGSRAIELSELLRLVQFYNIGGYEYCAEGGEDRYCAKSAG